MNVPSPLLSRWIRVLPYALPALLLCAVWLPGVNEGWPGTDSHYYAGMAMQAWSEAFAQGSVEPLLFLDAGDAVYFNKPPLVFLIHGFVLHVLGFSMFALRLPGFVAALGILTATVWTTRRLAGPKIGLLTGVILASTLEFFRYGNAISLDIWQTLWFALAAAALVGAPTTVSPARLWRRFAFIGLCVGLALLTKQFVAALYLGLLAVWLIADRRGRLLLPLAAACALGVLIALPWHIAAHLHAPGEGGFVDTYLFGQVLERAESGGPVARPWWLYLELLVVNYWPWLVTLGLAFVWMVKQWRRLPAGVRSAVRFGLIVGIGWLVLITIFKGRSGRYAIPMYAPLAMLSAAYLVRGLAPAGRRGARVFMLAFGPGALTLGVVVAVLLPALGVDIHEPRERDWTELDAWLETQPPATRLCVTRPANNFAAHVMLMGREWPRLVEVPGSPVRAYDRPVSLEPGDLVLMLAAEAERGPADAIVWRGGRFAVTRPGAASAAGSP